MKLKFIGFLFFSLLTGSLSGQKELDGYTHLIPTTILPFHQLLEKTLLNGEIDSAIDIYHKMIQSIDTSKDIHTKAWVSYHHGDVLSYTQKYEESNKAYLRAINLTNKMLEPNIILLIRAHNNLNYNLEAQGQYDLAFDHILKAYEYLEYAPSEEKISNVLFNLARSLKLKGELALAGEYMERVIELDSKDNDSLAMGYNHQFLAEIYHLQKDPLAAIDEYEHAMRLTPIHQKSRMSIYTNGIARAYTFMGSLDSALIYANMAVDFGRESGMNNIVAYALSQKSKICSEIKDELCAKIALNEAILLANALGMTDFVQRLELTRAGLYQGIERKNILENVIAESEENEWSDLHRQALKQLLVDDHLLTSYEKIDYLIDYNHLLEDLITEDAGTEAKRLEARMALIEHEQQIVKLRSQAKMAKEQAKTEKVIRTVLLGIVFITCGALVLLYHTYKQRRQLAEAQYRIQITSKINEIGTLRERLVMILEQKNQSIPLPPLNELNDILDSPLTEKEYEVLIDVAKGMTNREIAEAQFVSTNTVKFHVKNIFFKLEVNNRKEAIKRILSEIS